MALMTRISRLFLADMNAILDQLEEPQALLKQALRDMEEEIARSEQEVREVARKLAGGEEQIRRLTDQLQDINNKVALALDADDSQLARDMLRRRLTTEQHLTRLQDQRVHLGRQTAALNERLADWRGRYEAVAQKLAVLESQAPAARDWPTGGTVSEQDVQVAYLAELNARQSS